MNITAILGRKGSLLKTSQNLSTAFKLSGIRNILAQKELLEKRKKNAKLRVLALKSAGDAINQKNETGIKDSLLLGGTALGGGLGRVRLGGGRTSGIRGGNIRGPRPFLQRNRGITRGNRLSRFRFPFNRARVTSSGGRLSGLGRNLRGLKGVGRVGPLNVLFTGADFLGRKASGQTNFQAGGGALAGLGGFLGGAKAGALAGGAIGSLFGGVGAAPGALIGGFIGGTLGSIGASGLFDRLSGADKRRVNEVKRTSPVSKNFNLALTNLDSALDKLEGKRIVDDDALVLPGDGTRGVTGGKFGTVPPGNITQAMLSTTFNRGFASGVAAAGTAAAVFMVGRGLIKKIINRLFKGQIETNRASLERAFNQGVAEGTSGGRFFKGNPYAKNYRKINKKITKKTTKKTKVTVSRDRPYANNVTKNDKPWWQKRDVEVEKLIKEAESGAGSQTVKTRVQLEGSMNPLAKSTNFFSRTGFGRYSESIKKFFGKGNGVSNTTENLPSLDKIMKSDASNVIIEGDTIIQNQSGNIASGNSSGSMTTVDDFQVALNIIQGTSLLTV